MTLLKEVTAKLEKEVVKAGENQLRSEKARDCALNELQAEKQRGSIRIG